MALRLLGEPPIDIHTGGVDLIFPHHENEIAQSEGASGKKFVNYWMHNGFVRVDNEKMSKSLGNFFTVREVLARYDPEVVRFFIARAHYRSPLNYSDQHLDDAKNALTRLYTALKGFEVEAQPVDWSEPHAARFREAMDDDFNTAEAVAVLFELANELNKSRAPEHARLLKSLGAALGLLEREPSAFLQGRVHNLGDLTADLRVNLTADATLTANLRTDATLAVPTGAPDELRIRELIEQRAAARKAKNFGEADRIRKQLADAGIVLEDTPRGTEWRRE